MFWTNKVIELVILLLGLGFIRVIIRRFFPGASDFRVDCVYFVLFVIAVTVSWIDYRVDEDSKALLQKAFHESQQKVMEADERESLRRWAMVTRKGEEVKDVMGVQSYGSKGPMAQRHKKVFIQLKAGEVMYGGRLCNNTAYFHEVRSLAQDYPILGYASAVLADCLKYRGDQSWREEGERARKRLEKLIKIQPHVLDIDSFYGFLIQRVLEEKIEDTGYFHVGEQNIYIPVGWPR